ncbi:MAG: LamG domain-containing protein, partial [Bacteroidaceae bacterium]|nr:LamG domain-containing protein [Bacteroidaceae bacterium]
VGLINQAGNRNWYFEKLRSGTCKASSNAGLNQQQWHNITVSADATAVRLYIDGQLRATANPVTTPLSLLNSTQAWLGRSPFAGDARMTDTFFDDLRFYDCALTPEHIRALYAEATEKSTDCPALQPEPDTEANAEAIALINGGTEVDITALLKNPDFADGSTGWEGTSFSAAPGTVAEHFYQLFDSYQILKNMPAGLYRLEWQGFYRNGNIQNAWQRHTKGTEDYAEVYASDASTPMLSLFDASAPYTYNPYTYPDNVATAEEAFAAGHYAQHLDFELSETSDLRIGLRHFTPSVYDWTCFDNFRLIYVNDANGMEEVLSDEAKHPSDAIYDLSGRKVKPTTQGLYIRNGKLFFVK